MPQRAETLARLIKELGGEGPRTDAGAIGLEDAVDLTDMLGRYAQTSAAACADGVARGDEGIGAEVDVQQRALGSLRQDALPAV